MATKSLSGITTNTVSKKANRRSMLLVNVVAVLICGMLYGSTIFSTSSSAAYLSKNLLVGNQNISKNSIIDGGPCSSMPTDSICCDRTSYASDVCFMRGDISLGVSSSSVILHPCGKNSNKDSVRPSREERIKPYTRKWDPNLRNRIPELRLQVLQSNRDEAGLRTRQCDVQHDVPAVVFYAGGYTGNTYHDFSDGLVPLYITSQHLSKKVVLVVLQYRNWWYTRYREILSRISDFPPIDFYNDTRIHCFTGAIVGLRFHSSLMIDPRRTVGNTTILDFHRMIGKAFDPRISSNDKHFGLSHKPKLVIMSRTGSRVIENEKELVKLAEKIGFEVTVLRPNVYMELGRIYKIVNSMDAMIGVHGAALTHFLFMRPGSAFIQIVPHGVERMAKTCFGEAVQKFGLYYEEYRVLPRETSLYRKYGMNDPIVAQPEKVMKAGGWDVVRELYLGQNVSLDISRIRGYLQRVFQHVLSHGRS